jgi:hypothetical protein
MQIMEKETKEDTVNLRQLFILKQVKKAIGGVATNDTGG